MLKNQLQQIIKEINLDAQRAQVKQISAELGVGLMDLAAALLYLNRHEGKRYQPLASIKPHQHSASAMDSKRSHIKMVRYRLNVGSQHLISLEELKKILINESGVDKSNIDKINIQSSYTLIDLPDNMPQDIFLHLKSVEINQQKLDIRRVKAGRNKRRGKKRSRQGSSQNFQSIHGADLAGGS